MFFQRLREGISKAQKSIHLLSALPYPRKWLKIIIGLIFVIRSCKIELFYERVLAAFKTANPKLRHTTQ
jgi:hypothetical protein